MKDCIFCKIAAGEIPSNKIYEDSNFLAFLDIRPLSEGMSLVIPKKHVTPNFPDSDPEVLSEGIKVTHKVANMLQKALNTKRVFLSIEGLDVDHLHFKLYPSHGKSPGEILRNGPAEISEKELEELAEKIRNS